MVSPHAPRPQLTDLRREVAGDLAREPRGDSRGWPVSPLRLLALMLVVFIGAMMLLELGLPRLHLPVHGARPPASQHWMRSGGARTPIVDDRKRWNPGDPSAIEANNPPIPPKPEPTVAKPDGVADTPAPPPGKGEDTGEH